jgi:nitrite reductase/ring-hydroxylating ferredoxin subunit
MDAIRVLRRSDLLENGTLSFEAEGTRYLVADVDGEIRAYAVTGAAAGSADRAVVAEGSLRCPLHGWPIGPEGRCGAADLCRYHPLPVEVQGAEIRVGLGPLLRPPDAAARDAPAPR